MNDRYRFRVWSKEDCGYMESNDIFRLTHSGKLVFNNDNLNREPECNPKKYILEQCTGLKDRDQKLIYEGDILDFDLSTPRNGGHYRGFIRWQEQNNLIGWMISDMDMAGDWDLRQIAHPNDWMVWGRIIGNIHENRELLEFNPEDYDIRV